MDAQIFWKVISIYNQQTLTAQIVTYVMPCPVVSLGIIVYAGYKDLLAGKLYGTIFKRNTNVRFLNNFSEY